MSYAVRRTLVLNTVVLVLGWIVSGCSGTSSAGSGAVGTSGQVESATIGVKVTSPFITVEVENRAGRPLVNMDLTVKAGSLVYVAHVPRMEASDKAVLSPSEFRGSRDGAAMNPDLVRAKEVVVTASDLDGKKYEATAPWKQ